MIAVTMRFHYMTHLPIQQPVLNDGDGVLDNVSLLVSHSKTYLNIPQLLLHSKWCSMQYLLKSSSFLNKSHNSPGNISYPLEHAETFDFKLCSRKQGASFDGIAPLSTQLMNSGQIRPSLVERLPWKRMTVEARGQTGQSSRCCARINMKGWLE